MSNAFREFLKKDSAGGILLLTATALALILDNTPLAPLYERILHIPLEIRAGFLHIDKSLYHWVNDGLMAIFFLYIGLEVKREVLEGRLSSVKKSTLPVIAALGGVMVPAGIFLCFNSSDPVGVNGWAIPTATDVAFALGILSLLGKRVPSSLKLFLMALAIIDDLVAITIIAAFYTSQLSVGSLAAAGVFLVILIFLFKIKYPKKGLYIIVAVLLWFSVLKSGVHATLAGVVLALVIPMRITDKQGKEQTPALDMEHKLYGFVVLFILPLFAFVNAGVNFSEIPFDMMAGAVPMGIMLGLFLGKQAGVFLFSWLVIKLGITKLPDKSNWYQFYSVAVLTGIGFTMSLFISSLAFENDNLFNNTDKLSILIASFTAGIMGYLLLRLGKNREYSENE